MFPRLKLALLLCKDPQYVVAAKLQISETRFSRITLGRLVPTDEEKARIAAYLRRDVADLFAYGDDEVTDLAPCDDDASPLPEAK
jgi:hypothetical protein